jgi:hypothetical protein
MAESLNNTVQAPIVTQEDQGLNNRFFWVMLGVTAGSVVVSALIGPWRFTTGLLIGGLLALFSHRWLRNSAAAAINLSIGGGIRQIQLFQFILRYLVVGAVIFAVVEIDVASLPAILAGMSSFVVALFVEALREFYFAFKQREEIN